MPILNYTTSIDSEKTASEIQKKLAKAKAIAVLTEYDEEGVMIAMSFKLNTPHGAIAFRLPANIDKIYVALQRDNKVRRNLKTRDQAARVAWRILKDWIEAQLAIVESEMVELTEVFLPYAQMPDGETLYHHAKNSQYKMLTHKGD